MLSRENSHMTHNLGMRSERRHGYVTRVRNRFRRLELTKKPIRGAVLVPFCKL